MASAFPGQCDRFSRLFRSRFFYVGGDLLDLRLSAVLGEGERRISGVPMLPIAGRNLRQVQDPGLGPRTKVLISTASSSRSQTSPGIPGLRQAVGHWFGHFEISSNSSAARARAMI